MTPAAALKLIRRRNGLSPTDFADRLGVCRNTVHRVEEGVRGVVSPALAAAVRRVFWFCPRVLANPACCRDPIERERHLTYLRPLGELP